MLINYENGRVINDMGVEIEYNLLNKMLLWNEGKRLDGQQSPEFLAGLNYGKQVVQYD